MLPVAKTLARMGFEILATRGTADRLREHGVAAETVRKVSEGQPHMLDHIKNGDIRLVINVSLGLRSSRDAYHIRRGALLYNVLYTTTISGAEALAEAIDALRKGSWTVAPLQSYHQTLASEFPGRAEGGPAFPMSTQDSPSLGEDRRKVGWSGRRGTVKEEIT